MQNTNKNVHLKTALRALFTIVFTISAIEDSGYLLSIRYIKVGQFIKVNMRPYTCNRDLC